MVMTTPITLSDQQLASLKAILHGNNRPVQAVDRRAVTTDAASR
jgi:carbonic anhydrase